MATDFYAQETEFTILDSLLPVLRSRTFLDIGAEKGSFAKFLVERGFTGALFEPFPGHQQELVPFERGLGGRAGQRVGQRGLVGLDLLVRIGPIP